MKREILAITTLTGTIIGVGIFALPYLTLKVGFFGILIYFFVLGFVVSFLHLLFGELALKTPDYKRLPGFAKIYLGDFGEKFVYISSTISLLGALLAYLIVGSEFLFEILSPIFGGTIFHYTILYFLFGSLFIYFGTKAVEKFEFFGLILFFLILFLIFLQGQPFLKIENLFLGKTKFENGNWFLPYGPILFSLWGMALIPEIEEMLGEKKKFLQWVIFVSILVVILTYLFFIFIILGIAGSKTTESALASLKEFLGKNFANLALFFGFLTTITSFVTIGLTAKKIFWFDLKLNKNLAFLITTLSPLILFFLGFRTFIPIISFLGAILLGIEGILVLIMYKKAFPKLSFAKNFLLLTIGIFLMCGLFWEIFNFVK